MLTGLHHTHIHNLSTQKFERTLGRMPQKNPLCHEDTADKKPMPKTDQEKAYLAQHKMQGIGKKGLCSNGKHQDIGQENRDLKRHQTSYRNSSLINKN